MKFIEKKQKCIADIQNSDLSQSDKVFIINFLSEIEKGKEFNILNILSHLRTGIDIFKIIKRLLGEEDGDDDFFSN